jgi:cytochrome c biogenesis protein
MDNVKPAETPPPLPHASAGPLEQAWRALNSLPVAVCVMLALAVLSALGTVIPQEHLIQVAPDAMAAFYTERFGAQRYHLIDALGLDHIYFTWYFFLLLLWLCVSAAICTLTRIKRTLADWRNPRPARAEAYYTTHPRALAVDVAPPDADARLLAELRRLHYRVFTEEKAGVVHIYADKGFWKRWGLVVLHISVLVLLAGAIYGKTMGVEGSIRLADGEQATLKLDLAEHKHPLVQPLLKHLPPLEYNLRQGSFRIDYDKKLLLEQTVQEQVPAELQDYYRYFVKDFVSTLTATYGNQTKSQEVTVNHPLVINKLNLYQSSYEQRGYITVLRDGQAQEYPAPPGVPLVLTSKGVVAAMDAASLADCSDLGFMFEQVKAGDLYVGGVKQGYIGPLAIATLYSLSTGNAVGQVLATPEQGFTVQLGGRPAEIRMARRVDDYSVFSYKRDPGIPVLYLGWIALILGIGAALYIPYGQLKARVSAGGVRLLASGAAARGEHPLDERLRDMLSQR